MAVEFIKTLFKSEEESLKETADEARERQVKDLTRILENGVRSYRGKEVPLTENQIQRRKTHLKNNQEALR